jgi:N-acetylmuramoyl-L-alanine amidase
MPKIFINPGHAPGIDPGAVSPDTGLQEADVVLKVGKLMKKYLDDIGYQTYLVQNDSLGYICREANDWGADLFVSIHCNSAENRSAHGVETWLYAGSVQGRKLAQAIQNQIIDNIPINDRGLKTSTGLYVLRNTDMPSALVELGFLSNTTDEKMLADEYYQDEFAKALARAITDII